MHRLFSDSLRRGKGDQVNKKMLPASWLEEVTRLEREIQQAPTPIKRHQPRIQRHQSDRMRGIESGQTSNFTRASYNEDRYPTPVSDREHWLWPKDMNLTDWSTGKSTQNRS